MSTTTTGEGRITRDDIRAKLSEIQGEVNDGVEGAKNQLLAVGAGVLVLLLILSFLLGRKGGKQASTVIEVRRGA